MSRFTAGFVATIAILVPAAWHGTDATIEKDGKRVRPLQREITIDGARVTIDVDHSLIHTGDPVTVKLRAFSDTPKKIAVDMTVMQSDDTFGSRVASPPKAIDKEHFTLEAKPDGGKVVDTRVVMKPNQGIDKMDWFRIYVGPPGAELDTYNGEDAQGPEVAAVGVLGWSTNDFDIAINPKGKLTSGEPFEVAVRVENTTNETVKHHPYIELGTAVGLSGITSGDDFDIEEVSDESETYSKKWKAGAVYTQRYTVTPKRPDIKTVTFVASAYLFGDDMAPPASGAFEAQTFKVKPVPAEEPQHEVAEK